MKRLLAALLVTLPLATLAACDDGYGYGGVGYASTPYAYNGYYDGFYGPIYDGYWGSDRYFYYRRNADDRRFYRGDLGHFDRERARGEGWREMHGSFMPQRGYRMPRFDGGQQRGEGRRGGERRDGDRRGGPRG